MAVLAAALIVSACSQDDPFRPSATSANVITGVSLASFSTGAVAQSAIDLINLRAVRPEVQANGLVNFQLAVDLDVSGKVNLLPVLSVLNPPGGANTVGLARSTATFEALVRAPTGGFRPDTAMLADVGETILLEVQAGTCVYGDPLYGKLVVDGVNTATRRVILRFMLNRNCGYRDLTEGIPRN